MPNAAEVKCSVCGSRKVAAKIKGKYYCYECGARIMMEHVDRLIKELREKGLIEI